MFCTMESLTGRSQHRSQSQSKIAKAERCAVPSIAHGADPRSTTTRRASQAPSWSAPERHHVLRHFAAFSTLTATAPVVCRAGLDRGLAAENRKGRAQFHSSPASARVSPMRSAARPPILIPVAPEASLPEQMRIASRQRGSALPSARRGQVDHGVGRFGGVARGWRASHRPNAYGGLPSRRVGPPQNPSALVGGRCSRRDENLAEQGPKALARPQRARARPCAMVRWATAVLAP